MVACLACLATKKALMIERKKRQEATDNIIVELDRATIFYTSANSSSFPRKVFILTGKKFF